jgi:predicted Zn-dependent peptidase
VPVSLSGSGGADSTQTLADDASGVVRRSVLPGGLRVITEAVPGVRSVAFGVWAAVGSRDEDEAQAGCSHFLEHLLFKGTDRRDALAISAAIESRGGDINAFTTKESTCYYARVLDVDAPMAIDVVMDLVLSSLIRPADLDAERDVILEEIAMHADEPADAVHDLFATAMYGDSPMGRPILGSNASIEAMARDTVDDYYRSHYLLPRLVVAAAGHLDHDAVVAEVAAALDRAVAAGLTIDTAAVPQAPRIGVPVASVVPVVGRDLVAVRQVEQAHLLLGRPGLSMTDDRRFALGVLNAALGGGMSSRLFQEVRERRGLAYSVYSFASQHSDGGMVGVYAGCLPGKVDEVLAVCRDQLASVAADGLTDDEAEQGRGQLIGSLVLRQEDTGSRMSRLGKSELFHRDLWSLDDIVARVAAVTPAEVATVAAELFGGPETVAAIGPFADDRRLAAALP